MYITTHRRCEYMKTVRVNEMHNVRPYFTLNKHAYNSENVSAYIAMNPVISALPTYLSRGQGGCMCAFPLKTIFVAIERAFLKCGMRKNIFAWLYTVSMMYTTVYNENGVEYCALHMQTHERILYCNWTIARYSMDDTVDDTECESRHRHT